MQLKRKQAGTTALQIGGPLAAATCALLGPSTPSTVIAQELAPWEFDTAMLVYGEADGRVKDVSFNALGTKEIKEESFLTLTFAFDALTGASPSGAAPNVVPQTFTGPSGGGSYVIAPGDLPLDDAFHDTRVAASASWKWPLTRLLSVEVGGNVSDEYDYTHLGLDARLARDFNNRNTSLAFGVALGNDTIDPVGGAPTPFTMMLGPSDDGRDAGEREEDDGGLGGGSESKNIVDFLLGVTQVLNRHTIVQVNYSLSQSDGYLNDPYKILSVVDPLTGLPAAGPPGMYRYLYEGRPDTREKQSLYGLLKRDLNGDVFDISYRYMTDDWGIDSQTVDVHYRWQFGDRYLQPHVRFYSQTAADFYATVLFDGQPLPAFASADHRLGEFNALTLGIKYGQRTRSGEIAARLELYRQSGDPSPSARVGVLTGLDLYPDLNAIIAQFSYNFGAH